MTEQVPEVVRSMEDEDLEQVFRIELSSYDFPWTLQIFRDCRRVGYICLVLASDDEIYGYAIVSCAAGEAHILNICIDPARRSAGRARAMIAQIFATATVSGAKDIFLEVRPSNVHAISLYRKVGFKEIGRRENYYNAHGGKEDALVMKCSLTESLSEYLASD